eukprot:TRINITY_DN1890_c1_g1_i4.p1 TRINITY_DN1890_c1_g1~~TRINITY_DN1890_c1_g1_i4.p1  ORF type:complete len:349 (-),score=34.21 TRINITY_DN1890_c1_g1_i4:191-1237(-)
MDPLESVHEDLDANKKQLEIEVHYNLSDSSYQLQRQIVNDTEIFYELPGDDQKVKGLLFLAHGCKHRATDFWPKSELCVECMGLPEFSKMRQVALQLNYVVLAISSSDSETKCWDVRSLTDANSKDADNVVYALNQLIELNNWAQLPLYAIGSSSGGLFVLYLSQKINIQGLCVQGAALSNASLEKFFQQTDKTNTSSIFPPTIFIHMKRDTNLHQRVKDSINVFNQSKILTHEIEVQPKSINSSYFQDRIEGFSSEFSQQIYEVFSKESIIDKNGYLVNNPKTELGWISVLTNNFPQIKEYDSLDVEESPIMQELLVAWGYHQMVADYTEFVLDWFQNITIEQKQQA